MRPSVLVLATLPLLLAFGSCGRSDPRPARSGDGPLVSTAVPSAATLDRLGGADRLDGTEDKVITLCPSCGLHMAGKAEFSCRIGEYTTHSCTARCNRSVCDDPDRVFGAIEMPKK